MNESDMGISMVHHPLMADNLIQYEPYVSETTYLLTSYNASIDVKPADFVQAFGDIFSLEVWMCFIAFTFIFWLIVKLYVKYVIRGTMRDDALYEVLTHLFQVETIDYQGSTMRVTSLLLTIFSFYIIGYFTLSMKTDIVVVPDSFIVRSYDDLLGRERLRLIFPEIFDVSAQFEFAAPDSKENQLWRKSLKEYKGKRGEMYFEFAGDVIGKIISIMRQALLQQEVIYAAVILEHLQKAAWKLGCLVKTILVFREGEVYTNVDDKANPADLKNVHFWTSKDPDSKELIMSMAHSAFYTSSYAKKVYSRSGQVFAMGSVLANTKNMDQPPTDTYKIANQKEGDVYSSCLVEDFRDNLPLVEFDAFALMQFTSLRYLYGLLIAMAFICLVGESTQKRLATQCAARRAIERREKIRRMGRRAVHLRSLVLSRPIHPSPSFKLVTRPNTSLH